MGSHVYLLLFSGMSRRKILKRPPFFLYMEVAYVEATGSGERERDIYEEEDRKFYII